LQSERSFFGLELLPKSGKCALLRVDWIFKNMSDAPSKPQVMHSFSGKGKSSSGASALFILLLALCLGVGAGYGLAKVSAKTGTPLIPLLNVYKVKTFGSTDTSTFKDAAEGTLQNGGIDGEGQYHLVRPGGDSQNVYLTSSTLDLSKFMGKKIKVWGQTQAAQKAGWLMDVGKVQVE